MSDADVSEEIVADAIGGVGARVSRNFALSMLRMAMAQVIALAVFVVLARRLSAPDYALYGAVAAAGPAIFVLLTGSLGTALVRQQTPLTARQLHAATGLGAISLAACAVCAIIVGTVLGASDLGLGFAAYLLLLVPCLASWIALNRALRSAHVAFVDFADRAGYMLGALVLILVGLSAPQAIAIAVVVSGCAAAAVAVSLSRCAPRLASPRALGAPRIVVLSALAMTSSSVALDILPIPLVSVVASPTQAGNFAWAMSVMTVPLSFAAVAYQVLLPGFSRTDGTVLGEALERSARIVSALAILAVATILGAVPSTLGWAFPHHWHSAFPALRVLAACTVVYATALPPLAVWSSRGNLRTVARAQFSCTLLGIALAGVLGWRTGAAGAAIGLLASRALLLGLAYAHARGRGLSLPAPARVVVGAAASVAAGLLANAGVRHFDLHGVSATLLAMAGGLVLGVVCVLVAFGRGAAADVRSALGMLGSTTAS